MSCMDNRRESRFRADEPVRVTVLDGSERHIAGTVADFSGRGLGVRLQERVMPGTALKIECDDSLLLGDVVYCEPRQGGYAAGVKLQHALYHVSDLARMSAAILGKTPEATRASAIPHR